MKIDIKELLRAGTTTVSNFILKYYHKIGLSEAELTVYLMLFSAHEQGNSFPDFQVIAADMEQKTDEIYQLVHQMIQKRVIALESGLDSHGKQVDYYDLTLIFDRINDYLKIAEQKNLKKAEEISVKELYRALESEFGRMLSQIELETVRAWLDEDRYSAELIYLALKEAVLNQAYSLKYMDRILLSWERKNIRSKQDVLKEQASRRQHKDKQQVKEDTSGGSDFPDIPLYNWSNPKK